MLLKSGLSTAPGYKTVSREERRGKALVLFYFPPMSIMLLSAELQLATVTKIKNTASMK